MASHFVRWTFIHNSTNIQRIPEKLVENTKNFSERRRERYLAARMLLAELMLRLYGIPQLPAVITTSSGRSCFADPELPDFSIAYAGNMVGVLLAEENGRAGLGMEIVRAHSRQTIEHHLQHLSSAEKAWVNAQHDPIEAITQLWVIRQSVTKLTGEAESGNELLQLHPAAGRLRSQMYRDIEAFSDVEPLMVWSCALSPAVEKLHLWEYQQHEEWRQLREIQLKTPARGPFAIRLTSLPYEKKHS
ncbi:4'-phosphopantetheinyl transferase superfamily protein [Paramixta manurensis]|uniref:4'-phosphopantetheinyl transferase superfamily protein n=1 Tax=Paramixta manurensis TaxID=2740817 RepID=A0A6M8UN43_9GAMM|nr:4'-phosphopantetheinyl transferase superfamily protein [Erwiniaceae bacterium PD-1]